MPNGGTPNGGTRLGAMAGPEIQQFTREFRLRRENAEQLRGELRAQGLNTRELDRAIEDMRQLENARAFGDPKNLESLQGAMIEGLKTFEFGLYRSLGMTTDGRPGAGGSAPVPAEYRAMVEEYYRSLSGSSGKAKPKKP